MAQTWDNPADAGRDVPDGMVVCGGYLDDECKVPVYFHAPSDADRVKMAELFFEVKNGSPMEPFQRWLLSEADKVAS